MTSTADRPLLLLLPGMDGTGRLLQPLAARLRDVLECRIVEYPHETPGYDALTELLAPQLPQSREFVLLGESFAGPIALALAARRPAGLRGVVLSASFVRYPHDVLRALASLVRVLPARAAPMPLVTRYLLGRWDSEPCRHWLLEAIGDVPPEVLRDRVVAALDVDATAALREVEVPLLYLRASDDRVIGRGPADEIVALARDATIVDVEGPHFLLQVATDACADAILAFVRKERSR